MVAWLLKVTPLCLLTMSPELTALLTRIDALVVDGVCTPAEAVEQRRQAFNTEVRIPPFALPPVRARGSRRRSLPIVRPRVVKPPLSAGSMV